MENLVVFKRKSNLIIGLQNGELTVEVLNFWKGGVDSCTYITVENIEVVTLYDYKKGITRDFIQIENSNEEPLVEICKENFEKICNYFEKILKDS